MTKKCGECDFTNRDVDLCPQCKEFQDEIIQDNIKAGKGYEKLFNKIKGDNGE